MRGRRGTDIRSGIIILNDDVFAVLIPVRNR